MLERGAGNLRLVGETFDRLLDVNMMMIKVQIVSLCAYIFVVYSHAGDVYDYHSGVP